MVSVFYQILYWLKNLMGLILTVWQESVKNVKISPRQNFPLYGNTMHVLMDTDCSIRVYKSFFAISKIFPIMLALCLMLSVTYYAQNYAGITGWSLVLDNDFQSVHGNINNFNGWIIFMCISQLA